MGITPTLSTMASIFSVFNEKLGFDCWGGGRRGVLWCTVGSECGKSLHYMELQSRVGIGQHPQKQLNTSKLVE